MSQAFGRNGELAQTGQLRFDDPYASTVGNGGAANSFPGKQQIEQQLVKTEKELSNLLSFLKEYIASEATDNASTIPPMDTQPSTTTDNGGAENFFFHCVLLPEISTHNKSTPLFAVKHKRSDEDGGAGIAA